MSNVLRLMLSVSKEDLLKIEAREKRAKEKKKRTKKSRVVNRYVASMPSAARAASCIRLCSGPSSNRKSAFIVFSVVSP